VRHPVSRGLADRVRQFVRQHDLARATTRVVVAVSGGSDSVALAHLLREMAAAGELRIAGAAHFNHQLREAADADERSVAALAAAFAWPLLVEREDVAGRARRERRSIEDAARTARHAFFERARTHFDADAVALGHTRDDQAETFLLRLLRGAGPRGLASMHPRRGAIIRPLLACRRADLRAFLGERHATFVEDESNADTAIPRNRVRAELLPMLAGRFNPAIVDVLGDEADLARETWEWMEESVEALLSLASRAEPGERRVSLDIDALSAAPKAVRRVALWRAMTEAAGGRPIGFGHVDAVVRLIAGEAGRSVRLDMPGHRVQRDGARLVLTSRPPGVVGRWSGVNANGADGDTRDPVSNLFKYSLSIPGEVELPQAGCIVSAEPGLENGSGVIPGNGVSAGAIAVVRRDLFRGALAVRNRRPGDRFSPPGLQGRKKLQDFLVDRHVARPQRDAVPIVVDDRDRIVWVAGYEIDAAFRVTDPAQAVVTLRLKRVGGSA
jgi:tRNA(Ile)-lysidine synthase